MGLSKNTLKLITSLSQKKYRQKHNLFVAEGVKVVNEFLNSSFRVKELYTTDASLFNYEESIEISEAELKKISKLKSPNKVIGVFEIPKEKEISSDKFTLVLDEVNDPGNLGTIIRLCDWFGITQLVCSKNTVDCFNFKVVQATMGSLTRVQIVYTDIISFLSETSLPTFTADMDGDNVYKSQLPDKAVLVMGNEANGISKEVNDVIQQKLTIPRFGDIQKTESLNVATATAILLSEFKRA
ncbi:RNA methyltransferase [uncultured Tenacibaculum sp.]|uniref:RNA methyltransferase n=1 Tax=uncultured Tenacibaculum sp. TaxID=174713 RepID=UPI002604DB5C|nr:RNA methyltransferase [uncultured Tenacibaculum sp.]